MSLTPPGANMAPPGANGVTPPGADMANSPILWWAVKLRSGAVGFVRGSLPPSSAVSSIPVGKASSLADLMTHFSAGAIKALGDLGANAKQQAAIIAQTDAGAGQDSHAISLLVSAAGKPIAASSGGRVSTAPRGDATPINQIPSPIPPSAGNSHLSLPGGLTGVAVRVLEAVGGLLLLVLGLRALLGGESPTVTLAGAARKVIR